MQDDNKKPNPSSALIGATDGQANQKDVAQTSAMPEDVTQTADETPIEVPSNPDENPVEESIAKDSMPEAEFEAQEEAVAADEKPVAEGEVTVSEDQIVKDKAPQQDKQTMEPSSTTTNPNAKWYIVHTYSGHENKVAKSLKQRIQSLGFEDRIFDIIVPMRNTIKVSQGKKETVKEKIFPGYVLVRMVLDDESWLLVRTTQGVTAFIGAGNKPTPISENEVEAIQKFMNADEPLYKTAFSIGEAVKITDGPFNDFLGTIDAIDEARGKLKVLVSIFGRETPVELDFLQVKKL